MAANPPYMLKNTSKDTFLFSLNHDDNMIDHIALTSGSYRVFDKSPTEGNIMTDLEQQKLAGEFLKYVGKGLTLTDKDGNEVTAEKFREDNPPS